MTPTRAFILAAAIVSCLVPAYARSGRRAVGFAEAFKLDAEKMRTGKRLIPDLDVTLIEASAPACIYYPSETPELTFQFVNRTGQPLGVSGQFELIGYHTTGLPGDVWSQKAEAGKLFSTVPVKLALDPKGWRNLVISPDLPDPMGGYALLLDLGDRGRDFVIGLARGYAPSPERVQYPYQSLDCMEPEVLERLGCKSIRMGVGYVHSERPGFEKRWEDLAARLKEYHERKVSVIVEFGGGQHDAPLGINFRHHLDEDDLMWKTYPGDAAWMPKDDPDFEEFAYKIATEFGWPKGAVIGFMLWNEPWEGVSISGWGADMLRYRKMYKHMGDAALRARKDAGVDVLIGGCDSSSNTIDKLVPEGYENSPFWPKYLDFCSIHYQGTSAPVLHKRWNERKYYKGRVLIWDTESWVANTADRIANVVATNRACGYDRALGIKFDTLTTQLSHKGVRRAKVYTAEGAATVEVPQYAWPSAASYLAMQHFLGERPFREMLFQQGLPWVYVFDGMDGQAEDGTVVVVGDAGALFHPDRMLFRTVRSFAERKERASLEKQLAALAPDAPERKDLERKLKARTCRHDATLAFPAQGDPFSLHDFYGNPVPAQGGKVVVPLDTRGFYLRANPKQPGSFSKLLAALKTARIEGLEPVELIARDMLAPIRAKPTLRVKIHNVLNRPVSGTLEARLEGLTVEGPSEVSLPPHGEKAMEFRITRGKARADNQYPLTVRFDGGQDGAVTLKETMRVNLIARRTITVDGKLDDWTGARPQTVIAKGEAKPTFMGSAWLPFAKFDAGTQPGIATGYLAYNDENFYFAAKVADDTPDPGIFRFAERDKIDDMFFYPEVCWKVDSRKSYLPRAEGLPVAKLEEADLPQAADGEARVAHGFRPASNSLKIHVEAPGPELHQLALYVVTDATRTSQRRIGLKVTDAATGKRLMHVDERAADARCVYYRMLVRGSLDIFVDHLKHGQRHYLSGLFLDPVPDADAAQEECVKAETARRRNRLVYEASRRGKEVPADQLARIPEQTRAGVTKAFAKEGPMAVWSGVDVDTRGAWKGKYGNTVCLLSPTTEAQEGKAALAMVKELVKQKLTWPADVRRYSYRRNPRLPSTGQGAPFDNILIAFNAVPDEEEDWLTQLPGRPPRFTYYKCSEYEYALNTVAEGYGGGFEVWRLQCPGMPRKHFYPRQPKHPLEGAVTEAKLVTVHEGNTRSTEVAIPWSELPHVKQRLDARRAVKFTFRVNHSSGGGLMELAHRRSVSRNNGQAFHVDWQEHWANEVEFAFERSAN